MCNARVKNEELWRVIPEFTKYEASTFGRIRNKSTQIAKNINVKMFKKQNRRICISLIRNKTLVKIDLHRIIALTFIPNSQNKKEVNHLDENVYNNNISNLVWATRKENMEHAYRHQLISSDRGPCKKIKQLTLEGDLIEIHKSTKSLEKQGYRRASIIDCCKKRRTSYAGFQWEYENTLKHDLTTQGEFKILPGFSNYRIYDSGNVYSLHMKNFRNLVQSDCYQRVNLKDDFGDNKMFLVHRLVALAFIPNPNEYEVVDHIDGNKINNCASNLKWCTQLQNCHNENTKYKNAKSVVQIDLNDNEIHTYSSIMDASLETGINSTSIGYVCKTIQGTEKRKRQTAGGYKWKYVE